ncbi:hypothetical protein E1I98_12770 [Phocaeicola dorei]|uniref:Uncharacterized protein n=1 Tax=Phocaeicola dorei TaxID=357276 RepID=A0A4R4GK57_9BACT|nr:hypothetical protein E1I98_12770 [Phocaeicola dorei]
MLITNHFLCEGFSNPPQSVVCFRLSNPVTYVTRAYSYHIFIPFHLIFHPGEATVSPRRKRLFT